MCTLYGVCVDAIDSEKWKQVFDIQRPRFLAFWFHVEHQHVGWRKQNENHTSARYIYDALHIVSSIHIAMGYQFVLWLSSHVLCYVFPKRKQKIEKKIAAKWIQNFVDSMAYVIACVCVCVCVCLLCVIRIVLMIFSSLQPNIVYNNKIKKKNLNFIVWFERNICVCQRNEIQIKCLETNKKLKRRK